MHIFNWRFFSRKKKRETSTEENNVCLKITEVVAETDRVLQRGWKYKWKRWFQKINFFKRKPLNLNSYEHL